MAVIIGRVSEYDPSNITIGGKIVFLPPEKRKAASTNFPVGTVAKVTAEKGTVLAIVPPSAAEMATFTRDEKPATTTPAATEPGIKAEPHTPITPPAAQPEPDKEAAIDVPAQVQPGTIISVMIGGTLNLGNYNNLRMEITATSAEAARAAFQQEINTTVAMMQGIIKQTGGGSCH